MRYSEQWFAAATLTLVLAACGERDPQPALSPPNDTDRSTPAPRSEPAAQPPLPADHDASLIADSGQTEALQRARAERERQRARVPREHLHWDEEKLREQVGIDSGQFKALLQARQTLLQKRVTIRTGLQAQRHFRQQAEATGDRTRLEDIETTTRQLRGQLQAAELAWLSALETILDEDQRRRWPEEF